MTDSAPSWHAGPPIGSASPPEHRTGSLDVSQLSRIFDSPAGPLEILRDATFSLLQGESAAILGPSGSGKSTLLHCLGGLDQPNSGNIRVNGRDIVGLSADELADFRHHEVGFVFQDHHLLPQLTAWENVLVPTLAQEAVSPGGRARAFELLKLVGLGDRSEHFPAALSGGERQRVALARALICEPSLLLADEPTGNLDQRTADSIADLMLAIQAHSALILVVVTHSLSLAGRMKHRYTLEAGRLVRADG